MASLTINRTALNQALGRALDTASKEFAVVFRVSIASNVYAWPRETVRSRGNIVSTPRDIVDTGAFRDSQSFERVAQLLTRFLWNIDYAAIIYQGYTTRLGNQYPARDWIQPIIDSGDALDIFIKSMRREFR